MADPIARASILIRRPVAEVFDAFVRPDKITQFWLESTTGPLAKGAQVTWCFMVPGATQTVTVTEFEAKRRIAFDWSDGNHVNMDFDPRPNGATRVSVAVTGFVDGSKVDQAVNATEGFSIVLCDLKTLLESGRSANLVKDKAELIASA
jgi:uncharacterized protein YndB with AHSA1/START domain